MMISRRLELIYAQHQRFSMMMKRHVSFLTSKSTKKRELGVRHTTRTTLIAKPNLRSFALEKRCLL